MKITLKQRIQTFWPFLALFAVEIILAITNYRPGTYLMGWDNVMPEFNFRQAFLTNIFGVWQEHRGLGLPDGMGHAANLAHTVFLWMLSAALPQNTLRYALHFLLHLMGMIGVIRVIREIRGDEKNQMLPLLGALFYGLNLVTIQMFYTPLEAFSFHFAALPWLAYSLYRKNILLFVIVSLLTTPQFFIPTLLLPTVVLILLFSAKKLLLFLAINAFWLLPYLYNLPYNAPIIRSAKINQMSSEEVYERNRAFGDIKNVGLMRGFMLDFEDVNAQGTPIFVMDTWRNWVNNPSVMTISMILAGFVLIGLIRAPFVWKLLFGIPILFLANNTPGVSDAMNMIRDRFPLFAEAYRFPFTKFSILYGFASSILLVYGISFVRGGLAKLIFAIAVFTIALPAFQGAMFYDALRVKLPDEYLTLFAFMQKQDPSGRILYLPAPSYWSWKHYNFGYVGSGFLWYGLNQPLLDRAFDPWSQYNEQAYWDLSHAIYTKNPEQLLSVLTTYDIRYVVFDGNLRAPGHDRSLFSEETNELLGVIPQNHLLHLEISQSMNVKKSGIHGEIYPG